MRLTIYSKHGCHLCDEMKAVVQRVTAGTALVLEEIDISSDADLIARYGTEIPVLMIDGRKIAKYRITEGDLRKALAARSAAQGKRNKE